jgi:cytochrome P450
MSVLPKDIHPHVAMAWIQEKYDLDNVFYMDLWPVATPFLVIVDPDVAAQITQTKNHPKHMLNKQFLQNMTGEQAIVTSEGAEWKTLRSMLSPAFSLSHLSIMVPDITDHVLTFRRTLRKLAETDPVFQMQPLACELTIDVISQIVLGTAFNAQKTFSPIAHNFRKTISWAGASLDLISRTKNFLPIWWYCRQLDRELGDESVSAIQTVLPTPYPAKPLSIWSSRPTKTTNSALTNLTNQPNQPSTQISCSWPSTTSRPLS